MSLTRLAPLELRNCRRMLLFDTLLRLLSEGESDSRRIGNMSFMISANVRVGFLPHANIGKDLVSPDRDDADAVAKWVCEKDLRDIAGGVVANVTGTTLNTFLADAGMEYDVNASSGTISAEELQSAFRRFHVGELVFGQHEQRLAIALFNHSLAINFGVVYS